MKITKATKAKEIARSWHLVDLKDQVLGRIATSMATKLMGKNKPYFTANLDCGDYVVAVNSVSVKVTGKKSSQKIYARYSGYPKGLKQKNFSQVLAENPNRIIYEAVSGMLPKNKLRKKMLARLYIYKDEYHPHQAKFLGK